MSGWEAVSNGLLKFLKTPEALNLGAGLLTRGQGSFGQSIGGALQDMQKIKGENAKTDILKGHLDVDKGKLEIDKGKLAAEQQKAARQEKQMQTLADLFSPVGSPSNAPQFNAPMSGPSVPPQAYEPPMQSGAPNALLNTENIGKLLPQGPAGLLSQQQAPQGPMSNMPNGANAPSVPLNPPPMPLPAQTTIMPSALPQQAFNQGAPQAPRAAGPGIPASIPRAQEPGMITLKNGMRVTDAQAKTAQAFMAIGKPEEAIKALSGDLTEPEVVKVARAIYGDIGSADARQFMHDVKLKPNTQVNIGDEATKAFVTKQQNVIGGVDSVLPSINEIIKLAENDQVPFQGLGAPTLSPNLQAKYEALSSQAIEPLLGSFALNSNEHNARMVAKQIDRQPFETKDAYVKRLKDLKADLINRRKYAAGITSFRGMPEFPAMESEKQEYNQADLEHTAKLHNKTVEQVKKELEGR